MSKKMIITEEYILKILEEINESKIINFRYFITNELQLNYQTFEKKLKLIKEKYPNIYNDFVDNINNNYENFKQIAKKAFIYMSKLIKKGIELEDGTFRSFDLFDYYILRNKYLENFSKKDLISILEELKKENIGIGLGLEKEDEIRLFINSDTPKCENTYIICPISKNTILSAKDELNMEEKEYLVRFMEENNVTFNYGNYRFGVMKLLQQRNTINNLFDLNINLDCNTRVRKK